VISLRFSGGVEMLTAMTTSAHSLRASSIGRLLAMPPVDQQLAVDLDRRERAGHRHAGAHRLRDAAMVEDDRFAGLDVGGHRRGNGIGSFLKSLMSYACAVSTRKNDSIETPAITPVGSARPPSFTPNSGRNSVL
jgi:hypothetical protein